MSAEQNVARFDGTDWSPLPELESIRATDAIVSEGALWIGGPALETAGVESSGVARRLPGTRAGAARSR